MWLCNMHMVQNVNTLQGISFVYKDISAVCSCSVLDMSSKYHSWLYTNDMTLLGSLYLGNQEHYVASCVNSS